MIRSLLWKVCRILYLYIVKPLLFRFSPDKVHDVIIDFASVASRVVVLRQFVSLVFKKPPNKRLAQRIHKVKFNNPVGLAAGFDKNGQAMPAMAALGFGFGEVGSVTSDHCDGNVRPWFFRLPKTKSIVVNAGLANEGSKVILDRLRKFDRKSLIDFPVVLSVAKANSSCVVSVADGINDYVTTIKRAKKESTVAMFELNISCPNTHGGEPFTNPVDLNKLLMAVDKVNVKQPVYVKMPSNLTWSEFKRLLDVIVKHQIAGVTVTNLHKDRSKLDLADHLPDGVEGNFSGRPTWKGSNDLIQRVYAAYGDKLTIIGVGGIFSAEDAYAKIKLGASLVEFVTGMIFNGPQFAAEINDGLLRLMKRDGYTHISQVIGVDSKD